MEALATRWIVLASLNELFREIGEELGDFSTPLSPTIVLGVAFEAILMPILRGQIGFEFGIFGGSDVGRTDAINLHRAPNAPEGFGRGKAELLSSAFP
jgi:hypothetical protein